MQNDPRSHGLWEKTAPPAPATGPLKGSVEADVVVVGAGFTGLSAALHLASEGARVAVVEAVEIGFGGSGRNVGLVNAGMWVMPDDLPKELGEEYGNRLLDLLGNGPSLVFSLIDRHGIACEVERAGTLHVAHGPKGLQELEERAAQWRKRGAPVHLLDAAETARKVGSTAYAGALLDLRAGTIQPLGYVRGLGRAAIEAGAQVFTGSPVKGVTRSGSRWTVSTEGGSVTADWIVVATNAYTGTPWAEIRSEIVLLPYFNFATKPLSHNLRASILPERQGAWDTKNVLSSFRFDQAGRLVFGSVGALRGTGLPIHRAWAKRSIRKIFPQIDAVAFDAEWYGQIGMTDNSLPKFHVLAPNVVSFSGYNGRGIAPGTVFGRELALHVLGRKTLADLPLPASEVTPVKFQAARQASIEAGAQLMHLVEARL
ncbi:NAD(P)/FAD-dependent oxidoreductase [Microvirga pudoricolor]|uniref:NAD(P)/FAD-dependent oxidoreductase n=1 Tax=Microvirga pudoricolor TaxID=2778729 RepID=UPI001951821E|nr:FAD-binding oxidoreductase [Microvirga pudoricolor]MBM6592587.1 FAD-binding oxidoreductase [Microvirga pudoricolor]